MRTLALCALTLFSACQGVHAMTSLEDGIAQSDALLTRALPAEKPGCSAAVGQDGVVVWAGARGMADLAAKRPLTTDSVFDVASTSKQFTALAVLLLAREGALSLDEPLTRHLSNLPAWASDVTVEQLVHHRSGIPDYTEALTGSGHALTSTTTQADALAAIAASSLAFSPGTRFSYSNSNYVLLAELVQVVANKPLPEVLEDRVFAPLKLEMRMNPAFDSAETAVPYTLEGVALVPSRSGWQQLGDGSIFTTPTQLARWGDNYRTGVVGGLELIDGALEAAVTTDVPDDRYGPGIDIAKDGSLSHSGAWSGFATAFIVAPDRHSTLAISCNSFAVDLTAVGEGLQTIWLSP